MQVALKLLTYLNAQNSTITNNAGGIIKSNTNTITVTENSGMTLIM